MGLLRASREAVDAARAGDLDALACALEARAAAIEAGDQPTDAVAELGQQAGLLLQELRVRLRAEDARMQKLERSFCDVVRDPSLDVRG